MTGQILGLEGPYRDLLTSAAWLVAGLVALFLGLSILRRWIQFSRQPMAEPFTLNQLREMRDRGELTEQEYERARDRLAGRLKSQLDPGEGGGSGEKPPNP